MEIPGGLLFPAMLEVRSAVAGCFIALTARAPRHTIRKCRRALRRGSKSRHEQSSPTRAGLRLLAALQEFVSDHRPHGRLTADATTPAWNAYLLTVSCACESERWVTPLEAEADLISWASTN